jgi:NhaA family Na+:H+ antiporter
MLPGAMPLNLERLPREPADRFTRPFARFLRIEAAAGGVLLLCAVAALALSNSPWSTAYLSFWDTRIGLRWGEAELAHTLRRWIDDGAMTLFFFVVSLELKRETVLGELRNPRTTAFSIAAALGGMLVPAALFWLVARGSPDAHGWGIVMATDTAFMIGGLALLGRRIPRNLRLFLLSLAIFDDIGAILVIAIAYGRELQWAALAWASSAFAATWALGRVGIRHVAVYVVLGVLAWFALDASGLHPTLAGVVLALMTPARSWVSGSRLQAILGKAIARPAGAPRGDGPEEREDVQRAGVAAREAVSPVERLELALHPWVAFAVLPLFALANAGLVLSPAGVDWRLALAVTVGLCCGKPLGVLALCWLATRVRLGTRPAGVSWSLIAGSALLTGIGFTMSLLIAELALAPASLDSAKLGILCGSALSAASGVGVLALLTRRPRKRVRIGLYAG